MTGRTYRLPAADRTGWMLGLMGSQILPLGVGIAANQIRESLLAVVRKAGFSNIDAVEAIADLVAYVIGFTMMQAQRERLQTAAEQIVNLRELPADEFPHLHDAAEAWATRASERAFRRGLAYLIDGFRGSLIPTEQAVSRRTTKRAGRSKG